MQKISIGAYIWTVVLLLGTIARDKIAIESKYLPKNDVTRLRLDQSKLLSKSMQICTILTSLLSFKATKCQALSIK